MIARLLALFALGVLLKRALVRFHSWRLHRAIQKGTAPRGRTQP